MNSSSACTETSDSSHNHSISQQPVRQVQKEIISKNLIRKHLGFGIARTKSVPRNENKLVESTQSPKYKASGTKVGQVPAKSQSEAEETFQDTFKSISEEEEQCSSVNAVNMDEYSAPIKAQPKISKLKNANADLNSWRNELKESHKEASNSNSHLQRPYKKENKFAREFGHMAGYEEFQNDNSLPSSFGKKKAPRIPKLNDRPAKMKDGYASSKLKANHYHKSPPHLLFDICNSKHDARASTELTFANDGQQGSEMSQPANGCYSRVLRPGMVLLKGYLTLDEQVSVVRECRNLGLGPGGFYQPGFKDGAKLRLMMMCLGRDWDPQSRRYRNLRRFDNSRPPCIPYQFADMVNGAMSDSQALTERKYGHNNVANILPMISPNICIVNFYSTTGRLGLHQDRDESPESLAKGLPVVSISVGDSAEFLYGDERDIRKAEKLVLESGDVLIFGGESRHIFHGVQSIIPGSAPESLLEETCLRSGRLNLTFRQF